jgi:hypothetical protein
MHHTLDILFCSDPILVLKHLHTPHVTTGDALAPSRWSQQSHNVIVPLGEGFSISGLSKDPQQCRSIAHMVEGVDRGGLPPERLYLT